MNEFGLIDLGYSGHPFTWNNKRSIGHNIQERLDRGITNIPWCTMFPNASIKHLNAHISDRKPLLLHLLPLQPPHPCPFHFESMWIREPTVRDVVDAAWKQYRQGSPTFTFSSKLYSTKAALKTWNRDTFGNVHSKKLELLALIDLLQNSTQSSSTLFHEEHLQCALDETLKREEILWRDKARQNWLEDGDASIRFFHLTTIINRRYNSIDCILNSNHEWVHFWDDIDGEFMHFYSSFFAEETTYFPDDLEGLIPESVNDIDNANLIVVPSIDEIRGAVTNMSSPTSSGPDGFPPYFFKHFWPSIASSLISAAQSFFTTGFLLKS